MNCRYCSHLFPRRATFVAHDSRGCYPVCDEHAAWKKTLPKSIGHDAFCTKRGTRWQVVTPLEKAS